MVGSKDVFVGEEWGAWSRTHNDLVFINACTVEGSLFYFISKDILEQNEDLPKGKMCEPSTVE